AALAQARDLLGRLGALDAAGRATELGAQMARTPVHPRLAHMLLAADGRDTRALAARLAAVLSERDLLHGPRRDPDIRTRLELLQTGAQNRVDAIRQLARSIEAAGSSAASRLGAAGGGSA